MICCRNLSRRFGDATVVDAVSFEVPAGAICALVGPNGAGKSTTLKMLTGLLEPSAGEVAIGGLDVRAGSQELKRSIGVVPEDLGLFDDLTVEEHLLLTGDVYGLSRGETRSRLDQLLRILRLEEHRRAFAIACSHGTRKKTAFAMALLPNPRALILDEPFEAADAVTARTMCEVLRKAAQNGMAVLFTSHLLSLAQDIGTHFVLMRDGKIALNLVAAELEYPLERYFFELAGPAPVEEMPWLGSSQS